MASLISEARKLARALESRSLKLVLAESCTAGLAAASLGSIPGISRYLCGSFVVYRNDSKSKWLGISSASIKRHGVVSEAIASQMAQRALRKTPEADLAASITGHLGPGAPHGQDGVAFIAVMHRKLKSPFVVEIKMPKITRQKRQERASHAILFMVRSLLESSF